MLLTLLFLGCSHILGTMHSATALEYTAEHCCGLPVVSVQDHAGAISSLAAVSLGIVEAGGYVLLPIAAAVYTARVGGEMLVTHELL